MKQREKREFQFTSHITYLYETTHKINWDRDSDVEQQKIL